MKISRYHCFVICSKSSHIYTATRTGMRFLPVPYQLLGRTYSTVHHSNCDSAVMELQYANKLINERIFTMLNGSISIQGHSSDYPLKRHLSKRSADTDDCQMTCQSVKDRPVCASNGQTYPSKCQLRRVRACQKIQLNIVSKGPCPGEWCLHP